MSYEKDGQLEPKFVDEVRQEFLPDVMGYRVLVTEWSDEKFTLNIYKLISLNDEDVIQDGEVVWDYAPDTEKVREVIEETLEERAEWSTQ